MGVDSIKFIIHFLALLLAAYPYVTHAQTAPDAGTLQQQLERERTTPSPQPVTPQKPPPPAERKSDGITVTVTEFRFVGNTLLSDDQLAPAVAEFLNRPLDLTQLQAAAMAVANAYREAGWIVRAYLPQQEIMDGIVTIQIVEAVFGAVHVEGQPSHIDPAIVEAYVAARQEAGAPLSTEALDRGLLLANDLPGVAVTGTLRSGTAEGETDIVVMMEDAPRVAGDVVLDNAGARATGNERLTARAALASPSGIGDYLGASLSHSEGIDYLHLSYTLPVGNNGWRLGANASYLDYRLVSPEFSAIDGKGNSTSIGLEGGYPLIRSRLKNLFFRLTYDRKRYKNKVNNTTTNNYDVDNATVSLVGNRFDSLLGGGANTASLSLTRGRVDLGGSPNRAADAATVRTHGSFTKLRYAVSRQQVITPDLSLYGALSGQWSSKNLDSSEKFYLGGAYGVRAYPTNEGAGSTGHMANLELRWTLPKNFSVSAFYDWGRISQNVDNDFAGAATPNSYELKGHGLSLSWLGNSGLSLKATWARRDGNNPNPTATGTDQDGSLDKNRWWFSVGMAF